MEENLMRGGNGEGRFFEVLRHPMSTMLTGETKYTGEPL